MTRWVRIHTPLLVFAAIVLAFLTRLALRPDSGDVTATHVGLAVLGLFAALIAAALLPGTRA